MTVPFQCRECACVDVDEYGKLYRTCGCVPSESIEQKMECLDAITGGLRMSLQGSI